ncbi:P-loop containing region of AAA domain protein [Bordetella holmesii 41130]|nr:P-loop containing region of AAA domain protein [Bordetella holmesii 41130]EWM46510.1 P-loop containing region of AAA domain protein [Bordetella holmesii 35009]
MGHVLRPAAIELEGASFGWRGQPAVREVSGRFAAGCMTAIVGPNGAGKSTLVKGLAGVLAPMTGQVRRDPASVAWLPQAAELDRDFPISVLDAVVLGAGAAPAPGGPCLATRQPAPIWRCAGSGWSSWLHGPCRPCRAGNCSGFCLRVC